MIPEVTYVESKGRLLVAFAGDLKSTGSEPARLWLEGEWPRWAENPLKQVYLDLRNARIVDSVGLNWVFTLHLACRKRGVPLTIQIASPTVRRVFEFAQLEKLATIKYRLRKQL